MSQPKTETTSEHASKEQTHQSKSGLRIEEQLTQLQNELDATQAKADANWDKALRAVAELENVKRRAEKDVSNAHKFALERFVKELLPIIDSLEKALEIEAPHDETQAIHTGVELTMKMFLGAVEKFGLEQHNPTGEPFDPNMHEAMSMVPHLDAKSQTIIDVLQRGYTLNGRVIRPARVIVAQ